MRLRFFAVLTTLYTVWDAQAQGTLCFLPYFHQQAVQLEQAYYSAPNADSIRISVCRFYVSQIRLLHQGRVVYTEANSYHLLDLEEPSSLCFALEGAPEAGFDALEFGLGIDSTTHTQGALGGALDPTTGMYWTWQSGYINFKLEGQSPACPTRQHAFEFHLGGYQAPHATFQQVHLAISNTNHLNLRLDLGPFVDHIKLAQMSVVMSPGHQARLLSQKLATLFSVIP